MENRPIAEFLLQIKSTLVDYLSSIGDPITPCEHMDVILEGLPQDFDFFIALIESCIEDITIEEVKGLILA